MKFYLHSIDDALNELKTGNSGLSSDEAAKRLEQNGKNKLAEAKKESIIHMFLRQIILKLRMSIVNCSFSIYSS